MKKCRQFIQKLSIQKKVIVTLLLLLLTITGLVTGTRAWTSTGQGALNMLHMNGKKQDVFLQKFERDLEGKETKTPIAGATFYLYQVKESEEIQIGSTYTTDQEGKIHSQVGAGDYYFEEINPSSGYTFDTDKNGASIKKYPFTVTEASSSEQPIVIAYNQRQIGNLELSKQVKNADGSELTEAQRLLAFDFQVTFSDKGSYVYQVDGGEKHQLASGETLSLKHGQKAVFEKLPIGVQYVVAEKPVTNYEATADNSSGNITEAVSQATFVNTYHPKMGTLEVAKTIVNADGSSITAEQKKQAFEFEATFSDLSGSYEFSTTTGRTGTLTSGDTFTLVHDEVLTLLDLPIGFSYDIREKQTEDYTSSPSNYGGTVLGTETVRLPFINQYKTLPEKTGSLLFDKQVVANQLNPQQEFAFVVTFSDQGIYDYQLNTGAKQPFKSGGTLLLKHGEQIRFPEIPAGISYKIEEKTLAGYQPQLENVAGTVLSDQEAHFSFHNYQEENAHLKIEKIGLGEGFDAKKDFTFNLWINGVEQEPIKLKAGESSQLLELKLGDTWTVVEENSADAEYSQTGLIHGTGVVTAPNQSITVTQTNTHTATPSRTLAGQKTWSIPENETVTLPESITVKLKNKETIVAVQEVTGPEWRYSFDVPKYDAEGTEIHYTIEEEAVEHFKPVYQADSIDLTNIYVAPVASRKLPIEKRVTGDTPLTEEAFEFRLSPTKQALTINGAGQSAFEPVIFTQEGTYEYTISERNKGTTGYTYDESIYTWTIVVAEKDNQLVIVSDEIQKNGEAYREPTLVFVNEFDASKILDEKVTISGKKTWDFGSQPVAERPESITVLLYGNDQMLYQREVGASDDWAYSFVVNAYDEEGTKIDYRIDEVPVPHYQKTIDGFNLTNTYTINNLPDTAGENETNSSQNPSRSLPQTGEKRANYLTLLGVVVSIIALVFLGWRQVRRK
ncbi:conserved hypothetical protein [Carnobacterium maltaromaticum]|uniref:DUF7601 domain-containing protein n=1 Tax=Carnobacterium maltaromaticum TaxID=2751 RepID=UPI00191BBE88|nr:Cna B-type domain-containing protein [Carnobacterium maltaromaticum]CAD5896359.1 conserved hypothetical protein [Carnobacterium maltaromaticum]